jgi:integral membrane protein (TIGR01906 family)
LKIIFRALVVALVSASLFTLVVYTSIEYWANNDSFYASEYRKNDVGRDTGISEADLSRVTEEVQNLLFGRRSDFFVSVEVNGVQTEIFGEQEDFHMREVARLFSVFSNIRFACTGFLIVVLVIALITRSSFIAGVFACASATCLLLIAALGMALRVNFNGVFTLFHELLFDNDLWMFPENSMLIRILTLDFFIDFAVRMTATVIACLVLVFVMSLVSWLRGKLSKSPAAKSVRTRAGSR